MNALSKAQKGYSTAVRSVTTPRSVEYKVMAQITHRLRTAAQKGNDGFKELAGALNDNRRLWTIFAIDVADKNNALPDELKARILYLSEFTSQHTSKVLARKAGVQPLLEVNTAILRGLRGGAH